MRRLFTLTSCVVVSSAIVHAATLNVPSQYSTIQAAVNAAVSGDTIAIAAGTYAEAVTVNGFSSLRIQGAGVGQTVLAKTNAYLFEVNSSENVVFENFSLKNSQAGFVVWDCHLLTFQNLEFVNVRWGIDSSGASEGTEESQRNNLVRGCTFVNGYYGVHSLWDWVDGADISDPVYLIESNLFVGTYIGVYADSSDAFVVRQNDFLDVGNIAIALNNWNSHAIYENVIEGGAVGLFIVTYDDEYSPPNMRNGAAASSINGQFYNNIIYRTTTAGIYGYNPPFNDSVFWIRNNIFYQNSGRAIYGDVGEGEGGNTWNERFMIAYNDFYGNAGNFGGSILVPDRLTSKNIYTDPKFVDPANGNFALQDKSLCINTGTLDVDGDGDSDITDYLGRSRDRGVEER